MKVAVGQNYNANDCPFEESKGWFIHMQSNEDFKCNLCQENFISKSNFMKHRISKHRDLVQFCRNNEDCEYNKTWSSVSNSSLSKTFALGRLESLMLRTSVLSLQDHFHLSLFWVKKVFWV